MRGDMAYSALSEKSPRIYSSRNDSKIFNRTSFSILFKRPALGFPRPPQWGVERGPGWPAGRVLGKNGQVQFGPLICSGVSGCFWLPWSAKTRCCRGQELQEWLGVFWARPDERSSKCLVRRSGTGHDGTSARIAMML